MKKVLLIVWALFTIALLIATMQGCGRSIPFIGKGKSDLYKATEKSPFVPVPYGDGLAVLTEAVGTTAAAAEEEAIEQATDILREAYREYHSPNLHERLFGQSVPIRIMERHGKQERGGFSARVIASCTLQ